MAMERLKKMKFDFSDTVMFEKLKNDIVEKLALVSEYKFTCELAHTNSEEDVHTAILMVKENNPDALQCININCKGKIRFGPPILIHGDGGRNGNQIAGMTLDDFKAYMSTLKK
jgi:hypothetical protein